MNMKMFARIAFAVILVLVAMPILIALASSSAQAAGTGMPMMEGLKNPTELATLVEESLKGDPTGKKLLDPARCKKNGSCATAYDYFYGIGLAHPSAKLENIAELPRYLQSLRSDPAPDGKWHLSRLLVRGEQHTYDAKGWTRTFFPGETVWSDRNTSERILAGDCGNVIGQPVDVPPPPAPLVPLTPITFKAPPVKQLVPAPTAVCPKGIILFANGWTMDAIYRSSNDLGKRVEALIAAATKRDSENASNVKAYAANDVSGGNIGDGVSENIGDEIIRVVNVRAPLGIAIQVNLLDPVTTKVVEDLGQVPLVDGIAKIYLTEAQRAYIVETIWPAWFSSPTVSGGERRIWVLPGAWDKKGGRNWHWCTLQENATYWIANRPK